MQLSREQQAAVERSGQDACCVAGPGSGKTRVLVERFAWLAAHTARPEAILAITFTEKAAREIKARLVTRFEASPQMRARIERAHVSTIDGFCRSVLNEYALEAGIDPDFTVLDEYAARFELSRAIEAALNRYAAEHTLEFRELAERWAADDYAVEIQSIYDRLRLSGGITASVRTLPRYDATRQIVEIEALIRAGVTQAVATNDKQVAIVEACRRWLDDERHAMQRLWALANDKKSFALNTAKGMKPLTDALRAARELADAAMAELAGVENRDALATLAAILADCEREYTARKRALGALDFADLEERALALLESNAQARKAVAERFDAILMDELQDTNPVQWRIVNAVRREGRFFAVGDINQSIYGWRGAEPAQFEQYQRDIEARGWTVDRLQDNYRSAPAVIDAVMRVCSQGLAGIREHTLNAQRETADHEPAIEVIRAEDGAEESRWVAHRIRELMRDTSELRYSNIAVLARGAGVFDDYEAALRDAGIPVSVQRGRNFFDEPEIVDALNVLRVMVNPTNAPALLGVLRSPLMRVSDDEIRARHETGLSIAPERVTAQIEALRARREETPAAQLLEELLDTTGRWAELSASQRANVRKLYRILRGIDATRPRTLEQTLEELDAVRATGRENNAHVAGAEDAVQLLTIHAAKGLEFPIVFLAGMHKQSGSPKTPRLALSRARGLGATWRIPAMDAAQPDSALVAAQEEEAARAKHEEDRLLYVAMTRAERKLIFAWSERTRTAKHWTEPVNAALALDWSVEPNTPTEVNGVRLLRAQGAPPAFEFEVASTTKRDETAYLDALEIEHAVPSMVSATTLVHFAECPHRYALRTLLQWSEPEREAPRDEANEPRAEASGASFGDAVHRLLAGEELADASEEARTFADAFLAGELGQRAARAARIGRETPVLYEFEGLLVQGVVDLWFVDGDELVVVDYKTDRVVDDERFSAYSNQLRLYARALAQSIKARKTTAFLALLRQRRAVEIDVSERGVEKLRTTVSEFVDAHRTAQFGAKPGARCTYCAYARGVCADAARATDLISDPKI